MGARYLETSFFLLMPLLLHYTEAILRCASLCPPMQATDSIMHHNYDNFTVYGTQRREACARRA